ncbi:MAG: restriction endonuclease subunit S [Methylophilaceae bacterium]
MSQRIAPLASIRWFDHVPDGWAVERIKHVIRTVDSGVSVNASNVAAQDDQFGVLKTSAVSDGKFFPEENKAVWESEADRVACPVTRDTVIMSRMNTPSLVGESGYVPADFPGLFLPDRLWKLQFDSSKVQTAYISKVLSSFGAREALSMMATGTSPSMKNLSLEEMGDLPVPLPPLGEQAVISSFLESETARIDALIAEKERMLALLEEKRAAFISRVVSRGLDPNAPLKSSDLEWLGEIPAHWTIWPLKHVAIKIGSGVTPRGGAESYQSDGIPLFRSQNVHFDGLRTDDIVFVDEETHESMGNSKVKNGDLLLNITGASIGRCFYMENLQGEANVNQHVCIIRPSLFITTKYLYFALRSTVGQTQIDLSQSGSGREGLNFEALGNLNVPVPPLDEQLAITVHLEEINERSSLLLSEIRNSVAKLKERRAALITAAVSGQISLQEMTG